MGHDGWHMRRSGTLQSWLLLHVRGCAQMTDKTVVIAYERANAFYDRSSDPQIHQVFSDLSFLSPDG